jgi:uncharacterized protein YegP (UPF0339 family)
MPKKKTVTKKKKHKNKFRFEIVYNSKAKGKQKYYWRAISCNGQTVIPTEMYLGAAGPVKTIKSLITAAKKGQVKICEEIIYL